MGEKIKVVKDKMQRLSHSSDSSEKIKKEERKRINGNFGEQNLCEECVTKEKCVDKLLICALCLIH